VVPDGKKFEKSIPTDQLVERLNEDKEAPWADWSNQKGITPHKLAKMLKPFGVKSERLWNSVIEKQEMSYTRQSLEPVFDRYLPPLPPKNDSEAATEP